MGADRESRGVEDGNGLAGLTRRDRTDSRAMNRLR